MKDQREAWVHDAWLNGNQAWNSPANLANIYGKEWPYAAEQTWAKWQGLA